MDELTVKILSSSCKMSEFTQQGISCKNIIVFFFFFIFSVGIFLLCFFFVSFSSG